jgi:hypothetical protein
MQRAGQLHKENDAKAMTMLQKLVSRAQSPVTVDVTCTLFSD